MSPPSDRGGDDEGPTPLFGYGSLILPTSLVSRFVNVSPTIDEVYDGVTDGTIRPDAVEKWENRRDRIRYLPAKIRGFRRYYSLESRRGGAMLEAVRTDDPDDWINGMLVFGLTPEEREQIARTEEGYDCSEVRDPELSYYVDPERIGPYDVGAVDVIELFSSTHRPDPKTVVRPRNDVYHDRIVMGIMMIGEIYGSEVATEFYDDFRETTYEIAYDDASRFNTVKENDHLKGETRDEPNPDR